MMIIRQNLLSRLAFNTTSLSGNRPLHFNSTISLNVGRPLLFSVLIFTRKCVPRFYYIFVVSCRYSTSPISFHKLYCDIFNYFTFFRPYPAFVSSCFGLYILKIFLRFWQPIPSSYVSVDRREKSVTRPVRG